MIKEIDIEQYRKLKKIKLCFSKNLNAISGTNGTCKTSLLHLVSNSFQAVTKSCDWVKDNKCLPVISAVNALANPKVEYLTRGDKQYNDPAHGVSGILFTVNYFTREPLGFRRHNSSITTRYAVKPKYQKGSGDKLPFCPVIYLGLSRLVPFGEFQDDEALTGVKKRLPASYLQEIAKIYQDFTHYSVEYSSTQQMGGFKTRAEFSSDADGIDSNTISAGEDNLYIILTALVSLKYYYDSIESRNPVESILLVDELDATLHPAFQIKLLKLMREYSLLYKIQIIFTTHSMSTLEDMLEKKDNVLYLVDNVSDVIQMEEPNIYKIKMHLSSLTQADIYRDKVIPIFTEDEEARFILKMMLSFFEEDKGDEFLGVRRFLHLVNVNMGADNLSSVFKDSKLLRMTMSSICVLDGDKDSDLSNCVVALPGKNGTPSSKLSPEKLLFSYAEQLYESDSDFWTDKTIIDKGYGKVFYIDKIKTPTEKYREELQAGTTSKKEREFNKELFNDYSGFFELLFLNRFYNELKILFKKVAPYNEINPSEWK